MNNNLFWVISKIATVVGSIRQSVSFLLLLLVAATPALAGVGGSVVVTFPAAAYVGQTFQARLVYTNNSDGENLTERVLVSEIRLDPSCGNLICTDTDPGVFSASIAQGGFFCAGTTFTPVTAADGTITFQPDQSVELGPADGSQGTNSRKCAVIFNMTVLKLPTKDASPLTAGIQTRQLATAQFTGEDSGLGAQGFGTSTITVSRPVLSIAKTPDAATITAGQTATFTIVATNNGVGTALNVAISDPLPAGGGVTWATVTPNCTVTGAVGAQTLNCNVGTLTEGSGFTAVVTAPTSLAACAQMNNTATASASNADSVNDTGSITCQTPVLAIAKTPDAGVITAGSTATFTIVLTNNGPGTATGVAISDPLPAGGGVTWATVTAGCTVTGAVGAQTLNCTVGSIAAGNSFTAVVTAPTSLAACTLMNNVATATATNAASVNNPGDITCQTPGWPLPRRRMPV